MLNQKQRVQLFSFRVHPKHLPEWAVIINASTPGLAKLEYYQGLIEHYPEYDYTDIVCKKLGEPYTSDEFKRTATYRGFPDARCGDRVSFEDGSTAVIVGHNSSANFEVIFESGEFKNRRLSVHPSTITEFLR